MGKMVHFFSQDDLGYYDEDYDLGKRSSFNLIKQELIRSFNFFTNSNFPCIKNLTSCLLLHVFCMGFWYIFPLQILR